MALVPTVVLVLAPLFLFEKTWHSRKRTFTHTSALPRVIKRLAQQPVPRSGRKELLLLDRRSCEPWDYYTLHHPVVGPKYREQIEQAFEIRCVRKEPDMPDAIRAGTATHGRVWTVLHTPRPLDDALRRGEIRDLRRLSRQRIGPQTIMIFIKRRW
jgi:hypothetical protein